MIYSPEALDVLLQEIEKQGGALLPDRCEKQDIIYKAPPYAKDRHDRRVTCGCGHETMTVSVYDPALKKRQSGSGFVRACAVCDDVGQWPRYCKTVYAADPNMRPIDEEE